MARALIPNSTQIPDLILDQWMAELSGAEFKVLLYIARRTYGFGKESDNISLSQLASGIRRKNGTQLDRGTGLSRSGVKAACNGLIQKGLLIRTANRVADGRKPEESTYRLNLFAAVPVSEEEVGQKEAHLGQLPAYPEVGQKVAHLGQKNAEGRPGIDGGVGQKVAPQETDQETEQETASAGPDADADLIETLVREGVGRSTAVRLATTKPDLCRRYLDWLPFADVKKTRGSWLANAIEHEYGPPKKLAQRGAVPRAGRGSEHRRPALPRDREDPSGNALSSLRVRYAQLERSRPDAIADFEACFAAHQAKAERFAETLTENGRRVYFEQARSEEFRLMAFDRWTKTEGKQYVEAAQPDPPDERPETAMRAVG